VVGGAKRARADQAAAIFKYASDAVNARGFDGFFERHRRKNGGNTFGEHGFASAGRPDEENVVTAGAGHFESALGGLLAVNIAKVDRVLRGFAEQLLGIDANGLEGFRGIDEVDGLGEGFEGEDINALDDGGFAGVGFGNGQRLETDFARGEGGGEGAANGANAAVERKLAEKHALVEHFAEEVAHAADQAESHGEIEGGAFFADVGGGEIDGDALAVGKFEAAIAQRGFDTLAAFFHGVVGQADDVEVLDARGADVNLDFNEVGVNAVDRSAERLEEHGQGSRKTASAA